jgi:hypothetical protein
MHDVQWMGQCSKCLFWSKGGVSNLHYRLGPASSEPELEANVGVWQTAAKLGGRRKRASVD